MFLIGLNSLFSNGQDATDIGGLIITLNPHDPVSMEVSNVKYSYDYPDSIPQDDSEYTSKHVDYVPKRGLELGIGYRINEIFETGVFGRIGLNYYDLPELMYNVGAYVGVKPASFFMIQARAAYLNRTWFTQPGIIYGLMIDFEFPENMEKSEFGLRTGVLFNRSKKYESEMKPDFYWNSEHEDVWFEYRLDTETTNDYWQFEVGMFFRW